MALINLSSGFTHFIRSYASDPDIIETQADIETIEKVQANSRFTCQSPLHALSTIANHYPDRIALTYLPVEYNLKPVKRWTYRQYRQQVVNAANLFTFLHIEKQHGVLFLMPNVPEMLFGILGAQATGIAVPVNPFLSAGHLIDIARETNIRVIVTLGTAEPDGKDYVEKAARIKQAVPGVRHIVTVGVDDANAEPATINWHDAMERLKLETIITQRHVAGDDVAAYFHTGGTTGTPKLAPHTHRAQVVNVCQMALAGPLADEYAADNMVILCGLPLFHVNAVYVSAMSALMGAGELILGGRNGFREDALCQQFWDIIEKYKVTFFAGVPTVYAKLLQLNEEPSDALCLSHCACGAAPMPINQLLKFRESTGARILEGYGMTETTTCATAHYFYGKTHAGAIGMRIPYQQIRTVILDEQKQILRDCDTDEIGVVLLKGPNVIQAYKRKSDNADVWPEPGWLNSGDMGRIDANGYVWLTGRAKDLIIRGGHNIDPALTENALTQHPDVELAAAVGKPDPYAGELPIAYVQLRCNATADSDTLVKFAREHCAERAAAPTEVIILDELPKTAVGKTFKPPLRKDAIARAYKALANAAVPEWECVVEVVDDKETGLRVIFNGSFPGTPASDKLRATLGELPYDWKINLIY